MYFALSGVDRYREPVNPETQEQQETEQEEQGKEEDHIMINERGHAQKTGHKTSNYLATKLVRSLQRWVSTLNWSNSQLADVLRIFNNI